MKLWNINDQRRVKLHACWRSMRYRCLHKNHKQYFDYGKRGIKICAEWTQYENFELWARKNGYKQGLTIDRKNNNGNYEPLNCRWITQKENNYNKRNSIIINYKGKNYSIYEASKEFKIPESVLQNRIYKGWNFKKAIKTKIIKLNRKVTWKGKTQTLKMWSEELKIPYHTLKARLWRLDWSVEKSFTHGKYGNDQERWN